MNTPTRVLLLGLSLTLTWQLLAWQWPPRPASVPAAFPVDASTRKEQVYRAFAGADAGFVRLPPPRPREWLECFPEPGQTTEEFAVKLAQVHPVRRSRIAIVPMGSIAKQAGVLVAVREYCRLFFGVEVHIEPAVELPADAWLAGREQYLAERLVEPLRAALADDEWMRIGLLAEDLTTSDMNFVFGVGIPECRVGVYSTWRLAAPDVPALALLRILKVVNHEAGHLLALDHCIFYARSMNGSNSLAELDGQPLHWCPVCLRKLAMATSVDLAARATRLDAFHRQHGLVDLVTTPTGSPRPTAAAAATRRAR